MKIVPQVYRFNQANIAKLPRGPWCYWVTEDVQRIFNENPRVIDLYPIDSGLKTSDNFRFVRWWWEVGTQRIGSVLSREQAIDSGQKWFPYAKGAGGQRYASVVDNVVNWADDGKELKAFLAKQYPYLKGNTEWCTHNENLYFQPAIVWSAVSSSGFVGRQIPPGVITSNANFGIFASRENIPVLLAIMNSLPGRYLIKILCPTINQTKGAIELFPIPEDLLKSESLRDYGEQAIYFASLPHTIRESSKYFRSPFIAFETDLLLKEVEEQINNIVLKKLGFDNQSNDIKDFMSQSLSEVAETSSELGSDEVKEVDEIIVTETRPLSWISYAFGIIMGRFQPGIEGALGCAILEYEKGEKYHFFSPDVEKALRDLVYDVSVVVLEPNHQDDLVEKIRKALILMLNEDQIAEVIKAIGGNIHNFEDSLRRFFERDFLTKVHLKSYQNRPIYWLLQSPKKNYSIYLYHERVTRDTLPLVRGSRYLGGKLNQIRHSIDEVHAQAKAAEGREKKRLEKELDNLRALLIDLEAFDQAIQRVLEAQNEDGKTVGWAREIDDGIILNLAPLYELIPSWKTELKKYWDQLVSGEFDWSHTAMRYWPNRVIRKCKTNKSFAIVHKRLEVYEGDDL